MHTSQFFAGGKLFIFKGRFSIKDRSERAAHALSLEMLGNFGLEKGRSAAASGHGEGAFLFASCESDLSIGMPSPLLTAIAASSA